MIWVDASKAIEELKELNKGLFKAETNKAIALAFNHVLTKQRTVLRRHIQKRYPDSALRISGYAQGKGIIIERANRNYLKASLRVSSKPIGLRHYNAIQIGSPERGQGVSVEVLKGKRHTLRYAFMVPASKTSKGVLHPMAKGKYSGRGGFDVRRKRVRNGPSDLPITKLVGPAVGKPDPAIWEQVKKNAEADVAVQLGRFFDKIKRGVIK